MIAGFRRPSIPIVLTALASACAGGGRDVQTYHMRDSAGVHLVTTGTRAAWDTTGGWRLRETLRIGGSVRDSTQRFAGIADLALDDAGNILVLDARAGRVAVYDSAGHWLRAFGHGGTGPGGFSSGATAIEVTGGDTVFVVDASRSRVLVFTAAGASIGAFDTPLQEGQALRWDRGGDGGLVEQVRTILLPGTDSTGPRNVLIERDSRGRVLDTLVHLPIEYIPDFRNGSARMQLFAPETRWDIGEHGRLFVGASNTYRIAEYDSAGTLATVVTHPFMPRPVTSEDQQALKQLLARALIAGGGAPPVFLEQFLKSLAFAPTYPVIGFIMSGPNGSVLVQHGSTLEQLRSQGGADGVTLESVRRGDPSWDVFDRAGRYLGVLTFPARFTPKRRVGETIYGIETDSAHVQYVVRFAIESAHHGASASESPISRSSRSRTTAR